MTARPLQGNYPATLVSAVLALAPFIVISTAYSLYAQQVQQALDVSPTALEIIAGLATGAYAWGALLGGDLVQRFPPRMLFLVSESLFVLGCLVCAVAPGAIAYGIGRVLGGLATGLLLVAALPPVIRKFPAEKLPITAAGVNLGFFGAVCIGPLLGGWVAAGHNWTWFYGALAALGFCNLLLSAITLPDQPPFKPDQRLDWLALVLGVGATALPFWAAGELHSHGFATLRFLVPLGAGLACFVSLLLAEYHQQEPLSPVKKMWNTQSVTGTLVAMVGGGVFVSFLELALRFHLQVQHARPLQTGLLFWPMAIGAVIAAIALGAVIRTRFLPLLIMAGMGFLIAGGGMLLALSAHAAPAVTLGASGLLGLGAGATVSPGLYMAGFSVSADLIGRVFALIELVRSLADYVLAPVMVRIAHAASGQKLDQAGVHVALIVTLGLTAFFILFGIALFLAGGAGLRRPDLDCWLKEGKIAIPPAKLLGRLR